MFYRIFAILLFVPFSAQAIECESESPLKVTMGDAYYDLDNNLEGDKVEKNHPLQKAIDTLKAMQFRSGHATGTTCKRRDGVAVPETYKYELEEGSSRYTKFGHVAWEPGNAKNQWLLNHRSRKAGRWPSGSRTGPLVERDFTLTVLDNGIGVTQTTYTNGYFAEQLNWTLLKR